MNPQTAYPVSQPDVFKKHGVKIIGNEELDTRQPPRCLSMRDKTFIIYDYLKLLMNRYQFDDIFYGLYENRLVVNNQAFTMSDIVYAAINRVYYYFFEYLQKRFFPTLNEIAGAPQIASTVRNDAHQLSDIINERVGFDICKLIIDTNAVISGSTVLSYQLNDRFTSNDIDIYINERNIKQFLAELDEHQISTTKSAYYAMRGLKCMYTATTPTVVLQLMVIVDTLSCSDFITNNFDFDFCCSWFDGKKIVIPACIDLVNLINGIGHIMPSYIESCKLVVKHDYTAITAKYRLGKTAERAVKYTKRGFKLDNLNELLTIRLL